MTDRTAYFRAYYLANKEKKNAANSARHKRKREEILPAMREQYRRDASIGAVEISKALAIPLKYARDIARRAQP